jgi:hypothetical protein
MCCLYADHHKREVERLKWQIKALENVSLRYWRIRMDCWSSKTRDIAYAREKELEQWETENKKRYNKIADAYHLALHVASLYGKTTFPHYVFEEMHVNSVDMEMVVSYAYKHGNE